MPGPDEANIGRVVALRLGCGDKVPAWTVMRNCASGMQALDSACANILGGRSSLVLAGGTDAMSHAPLLFGPAMVNWLADWYAAKSVGQRMGVMAQFRPAYLAPVIAILRGLTDPIVKLSMGQTAEIVAKRFGITREMMDEFAARSHRLVLEGRAKGHYGEIETLIDAKGNIYKDDDGVRTDSTPERLAKLRPVFDKTYGNVTAGNSSQVTDGAAMLILAGEEAVAKYALKPLGAIVDSNWAALDPSEMGLGPVHAITPMLKRNGLALADLDAIEINEAFAAQALGCIAAWKARTRWGVRCSRYGEVQCRRWCDRDRPPDRRFGRACRAACAENPRAHRREACGRQSLHRRGSGRGDAARTHVKRNVMPADSRNDKDRIDVNE